MHTWLIAFLFVSAFGSILGLAINMADENSSPGVKVLVFLIKAPMFAWALTMAILLLNQ